MYIFLRFAYAKFDVSHSFFSKVIEEKPLGGLLDPPLVQERLGKCHFLPGGGAPENWGDQIVFPRSKGGSKDFLN